jgi:hypothetical protein
VKEDLRSFFDRLGASLGISDNFKAWLQVSLIDVMKFGGRKFLEGSGYKLLPLLKAAYPEHPWKRNSMMADRLQRSRSALYSKTLRDRIIKAEKIFHIRPGNLSDWYNVPYKKFWKAVGGPDMTRFKALSIAFPEHTWHPWLFKFSKHRDIMNDFSDGTFSALVRDMEELLNIKKPEDWLRVSRLDIDRCSGGLPNSVRLMFFQTQAKCLGFLRRAYPDIKWEPNKMGWCASGWSLLRSNLEEVFSPGNIVSSWKRDRSIFVPNYKLAFEYSGPITYAEEIIGGEDFLHRREPAQSAAIRESYTRIIIPFWWNREKDSLLGEMFQKRRDLFEEGGPLADLKSIASTSEPISEAISRENLSLHHRNHLKQWRQDPRFRNFFTTLERKKKPRRRKSKN